MFDSRYLNIMHSCLIMWNIHVVFSTLFDSPMLNESSRYWSYNVCVLRVQCDFLRLNNRKLFSYSRGLNTDG